MKTKDIKLNLIQKIFLKYYCYPPPGKMEESTDPLAAGITKPLQLFEQLFGDEFYKAIQNKIVHC